LFLAALGIWVGYKYRHRHKDGAPTEMDLLNGNGGQAMGTQGERQPALLTGGTEEEDTPADV